MLTDDQRARCAVMCGWTFVPPSEYYPATWAKEGRFVRYGPPPPIETMPEEWSKLMERAMRAGWDFVFASYDKEFCARRPFRIDPSTRAGTLGECACFAALAMEDGNDV